MFCVGRQMYRIIKCRVVNNRQWLHFFKESHLLAEILDIRSRLSYNRVGYRCQNRSGVFMDQTYVFTDYYQNKVSFSFADQPFSTSPKHVWVICRFLNYWLLTAHPGRGWEFPGGKVEPGEAPADAAVREVFEETGATVSDLQYMGQYQVDGRQGCIHKNVYYADIVRIARKDHYEETLGPIFFHDLPEQIRADKRFSFMMKDDVLTYCLAYLEKYII